MSSASVLAYLDPGSGAALAALVASGAVGAKVVVTNAGARLRRRLNPSRPETSTDAPGSAPSPGE